MRGGSIWNILQILSMMIIDLRKKLTNNFSLYEKNNFRYHFYFCNVRIFL
jgi:hypothetical protein